MISTESPSQILPDSTLPITTVPMSLNLSIIGSLPNQESSYVDRKIKALMFQSKSRDTVNNLLLSSEQTEKN